MSASGYSFYVTGGTLRHDAPSYFERIADKDLLEGLLLGEFCYVLTSPQMGKSSLVERTAARLREEGVAAVMLDLTAIGQNLSADQWYDGLLRLLGRQLNLEEKLDDFWCRWRDLNPHDFLRSQDFKSCASAISPHRHLFIYNHLYKHR